VRYGAIFEALETVAYKGLVGLEYRPRGRTEDGLAWVRTLA
jgi:hydroxypyruvate isomerase